MTSLPRLTCEEIFRRLDDYLDRELSEEEMRRVKEHLDSCAQCASEHDFERAMLDQVRDKLHRIGTPEDLRRRVASAIEKAIQDGPAGGGGPR